MDPGAKTVVVVDDDRDIAELVETILIDEGFKVSCLYMESESELKAAIERVAPDCVLLDGSGRKDYGVSWTIAAWLASRQHPIPALMFTAQTQAVDEAVVQTSPRARAAHFVGMLAKPFDIDRLVEAVHEATGGSSVAPNNRDETDDHAALFERLREAGADDLTTSASGRVWVTFRAGPDRLLYKVYRWRTAGAYFIGRYVADGKQMEPLAQFHDLEVVIAFCLTQIRGSRLS